MEHDVYHQSCCNETPKVYWYDSHTSTEYFIVGGKNLGTGEYILLSQAQVAMQENDEIRVQNTGTNDVTYIATIELRPAEAIQFHSQEVSYVRIWKEEKN